MIFLITMAAKKIKAGSDIPPSNFLHNYYTILYDYPLKKKKKERNKQQTTTSPFKFIQFNK